VVVVDVFDVVVVVVLLDEVHPQCPGQKARNVSLVLHMFGKLAST
jgi:hypothetical protein